METINNVNVKDLSDTEFMEKYGKLVRYTVSRQFGGRLKIIFNTTGMEQEDLEQWGYVGLLKARDNFNDSLGFMFSTYAVPLIAGEIRRVLRSNNKVKIPRSVYEARYHIAKNDLLKATPQEIADALDIPLQTAKDALEVKLHPNSLNTLVPNGEGVAEFGDLLVDEKAEYSYEESDNTAVVKDFLATLDERDADIWRLYAHQHKTQSEIARIYDTSQVSISRSLRKVKSAAEQFCKVMARED